MTYACARVSVCLCIVSRVMRCSGEAKFTQKVTRRRKVCYAFWPLIYYRLHTHRHIYIYTNRQPGTHIRPPPFPPLCGLTLSCCWRCGARISGQDLAQAELIAEGGAVSCRSRCSCCCCCSLNNLAICMHGKHCG